MMRLDLFIGLLTTRESQGPVTIQGPIRRKTLSDWKRMAPPCRTFTRARRNDHHGRVKKLRSDRKPEGFGSPEAEEGNLIADRCAALGERQVDQGKWFSIENPDDSYIWELKSMKTLAKRSGVTMVHLDQCAYGGPYKKATHKCTMVGYSRKEMRRGASPQTHHVGRTCVVIYKMDQEVWFTSEAAEYPYGLCEAWAEAWMEWTSQSAEDKEVTTYRKEGRYLNKLVREELAGPPREPEAGTKAERE